jgi:radical SAM superfamily enzyme YgiQ (UPF0313 family)
MKKKGWAIGVDDLDIKIISNKYILDRMLFLDSKIDEKQINEYLKTSRSNQYIDEIGEILLNLISYKKYEIFGFSLIERLGLKYALLLAKKIRERKKGAGIVFGGTLAETLKGFYLEGVADLVVLGHAEDALLDFCQKYRNKKKIKKTPLEKEVQFIPYIKAPQRTLENRPDFNGLPLKFYTKVPTNYAFHNFTENLTIPYLYAYGCLYSCTFCGNSRIPPDQKQIFEKPINQIIADLRFLKKKFRTPFFAIYNEYLHHNNLGFKKLCQELVRSKLNLTLTGCIRGNIPLDIVPLLNKAGFKMISLGLESGSDHVLGLMQKGINRQMVEKLFKELDRNGIFTLCYIIVGFPGEKTEDFRQTFSFVQKNIALIDQVAINPFRLEHCIVRNFPEKFGIKIRENTEGEQAFSRHSPTDLPIYDEIGGKKWEEINLENQKRFYLLHRLFYLYKKIPQYFYRTSFNEIIYLNRKYKNHKETQIELRKMYENLRNNKPLYLKITNQNNIKKALNEDELLPIQNAFKIDQILKIIDKELKKEELIIVGGEPTLIKELPKIIRFAKNRGWKKITLETNGRMFFYKDYAAMLKESGLNKAIISIYGHNPILQDKITGAPGSFNQTIEGVKSWINLGGALELKPIVCEQNKEYFYEMLELDWQYSNSSIF